MPRADYLASALARSVLPSITGCPCGSAVKIVTDPLAQRVDKGEPKHRVGGGPHCVMLLALP